MATLKAIRKRVASVRNIQQITKAMKMVAAARLRRAQDAALAARPYATKLEAVLHNVAGHGTELRHPYLIERQEQKTELVLITSDRGLCGSFNAGLIRMAEAFIHKHADHRVSLTLIGRRGYDYFRRRDIPISEEHITLSGRLTPTLAQEIGSRLGQRFLDGEIDSFYILYATFRSVLVQIPTLSRVLPVAATLPEPAQPVLDYLCEPDSQKLLTSLLTRYVEMLIYRAMLESVASEHGARMTAMDNATSNASDMIDRLTLDMNRARQANITQELLEIVSTGQALA